MIVRIGVNLVIGDVFVYKTGFDNGLCGVHIVIRNVNLFLVGREHGFNAAPYIDTPTNIVSALKINFSCVAVVVFYSEKGGVCKRQNQDEYYKKYRLACSFGLHWQILHYYVIIY